MRVRKFHREALSGDAAAGGGSTVPPAANDSILADVESVLASMEAPNGGSSGEPPTPPASAQPPAAPAAADAPATPAAEAPTYYTDDELNAFEGEYDRRDFDWNKVDPALRARLKVLESGTGKYRSRLEGKLRTELGAGTQNQPAAAQVAPPPQPSGPLDVQAAMEEFLNPETTFAGLQKLLSAPQGKQMLEQLGYSDPIERQVVSEIAQDRAIQHGLIAASEDFPQLTADPTFTEEVRTLIAQSPRALAAIQSRNPEEATEAFLVASARVATQRLAATEAKIAQREAAIATREQSLQAREADLNRQIEATNRTEVVNPSLGGGGTPSATKRETSLLDDVNDVSQAMGISWGR